MVEEGGRRSSWDTGEGDEGNQGRHTPTDRQGKPKSLPSDAFGASNTGASRLLPTDLTPTPNPTQSVNSAQTRSDLGTNGGGGGHGAVDRQQKATQGT